MDRASPPFERLLADLSARFANVLPSEMDQAIDQGLPRVAEALEVDGSSLIEFSEDGKDLTMTHQAGHADLGAAKESRARRRFRRAARAHELGR